MKKFSAIMLIVAMVMTFATTSFAAESDGFTDIEKSYAKDAILELQALGIIDGIDASHFNPSGKLSRAEFVAIMVRALGLEATATTSSFTDVTGWAIPYIEAAVKAGIVTGTGNGLFAPSEPLTREAAAVILVRALQTKGLIDDTGAVLDFKDADKISKWAKSFIAIAHKYGLIKGNSDGTFNPQGTADRAMSAVMGSNLLEAIDTVPPIPTTTPSPSPSPSPTPSPTPTPSAPPASSGGGGGGGGGGGVIIIPTPTPTPITLSSIAITTPATKLIYNIGDSLDITGMVVTGTYSNGTTAPVTVVSSNVTGFNSAALVASQSLMVTVGGKTTSYTISVVPEVADPETLLSGAAVYVYADNLNKPWTYGSKTYAPNTVFQTNVNFATDTLLSDFMSAEVSLYDGDTLLSTNIATEELLSTDYSYVGLTGFFAIGDEPSATDDPNWIIGGYESSAQPTRVEFRLLDNQNILHIASASMAPADTTPPVISGASLTVDNGLLLNFSIDESIDFGTFGNVIIGYFTKNLDGTLTPISNTLDGNSPLEKNKLWSGYLWDVDQGINYSMGAEGDIRYPDLIPANANLSTLVRSGYHSNGDMDYVNIDWTQPATYVVMFIVTDNAGNLSEVEAVEATVAAPVGYYAVAEDFSKGADGYNLGFKLNLANIGYDDIAFIAGTIKDADGATIGQVTVDTPERIQKYAADDAFYGGLDGQLSFDFHTESYLADPDNGYGVPVDGLYQTSYMVYLVPLPEESDGIIPASATVEIITKSGEIITVNYTYL